jgi:hypothetical protein
MGAVELTLFLSSLAPQDHVAASTQNQALSALLFLRLGAGVHRVIDHATPCQGVATAARRSRSCKDVVASASTVSESIQPAGLAPRRRFALLDPTRPAMVETHEQEESCQDMASVALRLSRSFSYPTASESSALAFALRVGEAGPTGAPKPRLLDRLRAAIRARHYSRRTEKAYVAWIRRYIFFHDKRHPADMGAAEVTRFLSALAVEGRSPRPLRTKR